MTIKAGKGSAGWPKLVDGADVWSKIFAGVFGIDSGFDRPTITFDVALMPLEGLTNSNFDLSAD